MKRKLLIPILFLLPLSSCGTKYDSYAMDIGGSGNNVVVTNTQNKIIYSVSYQLEDKNYLDLMNTIQSKVADDNYGYISDSYTSESYCNVVYKIDTTKLNDFLDYVDSFGKSSSKSISTEDITVSYNYSSSYLETLRATKTTYLSLYDTAKNNNDIDGVTTILKELTEIDTKITELENLMNTYNNSLAYSKVRITYSDSFEDTNAFSEYGQYLLDFVTGIAIFVLYALPFAILGGLIYLLIRFIIKRKKRNKIQQNNE